jgi:hypothetical protein
MAGTGQFQDPVAASPPRGIGPQYPLNIKLRRSHSQCEQYAPAVKLWWDSDKFVFVTSTVLNKQLKSKNTRFTKPIAYSIRLVNTNVSANLIESTTCIKNIYGDYL